MTRIDTDKLRALDEAANEAWTEFLTLGEPHPSVTPEARQKFAFMTGFCTSRRQSDAAILAMAEDNRRLREALGRSNRFIGEQIHSQRGQKLFEQNSEILARQALAAPGGGG